MDEERITLDREAFRALASESRVTMLKALGARRKTPSELSRELGLTVQSVSEHLSRLEDAGLVERRESGRKWVYYELTPKGQAVIHPESSRARVWVVLGLTLLALGGFAFLYYTQGSQTGTLAAPAAPAAEGDSFQARGAPGEAFAPVLSAAVPSPTPSPANATSPTPSTR